MDPAKIQFIVDWLTPTNITTLHSFLGLASSYMKFIKDFGDLAALLTDLTKHESFVWSNKNTSAFDLLKEQLTSAPVLVLPDWS